MASNTETWRNVGKGQVAVVKLDPRGNIKHEVVSGGRTVQISKEERELNQDRSASIEQDAFHNGMLIPVRLLDGDESEVDLANTNLISDSEIEAMIGEHWRTFEKKISEIDNAITLARILEVASKLDATVKQVKKIRDRIEVIDPSFLPVVAGEITHLGHIQKGGPDEKRFGPEGEYEPTPVSPR